MTLRHFSILLLTTHLGTLKTPLRRFRLPLQRPSAIALVENNLAKAVYELMAVQMSAAALSEPLPVPRHAVEGHRINHNRIQRPAAANMY